MRLFNMYILENKGLSSILWMIVDDILNKIYLISLFSVEPADSVSRGVNFSAYGLTLKYERNGAEHLP